MDHETLAKCYDALGDVQRVQILAFVSANCCEVGVTGDGQVAPLTGPTAGEICCAVSGAKTINSKVGFHINKLKKAGLINVERRGKFMVCTPNKEALARLASFLETLSKGSECC